MFLKVSKQTDLFVYMCVGVPSCCFKSHLSEAIFLCPNECNKNGEHPQAASSRQATNQVAKQPYDEIAKLSS